MRLAMEYTKLDSIYLKALPDGIVLRTCSRNEMMKLAPLLWRNFPGWQEKLENCYCDSQKQKLFALYLAKMPVASCLAQITSEKIGILSMVAVDSNYRRQGLGKAVVFAALNFFRKTAQRKAVLVTDSSCLDAIGFYLKLGFRPLLLNQKESFCWKEVLQELQGV
jgi:ribosomal protein S18 acetylase RimI-like enzyme